MNEAAIWYEANNIGAHFKIVSQFTFLKAFVSAVASAL
jgi:hypothetical protein